MRVEVEDQSLVPFVEYSQLSLGSALKIRKELVRYHRGALPPPLFFFGIKRV